MSSGWKYVALSRNPPVSIYDHYHLFSHHATPSKACLLLLNNLIWGIEKVAPQSPLLSKLNKPRSLSLFIQVKCSRALGTFVDFCWTYSSLSITFLSRENRCHLTHAKGNNHFPGSTGYHINNSSWWVKQYWLGWFVITTTLVEHFQSIDLVCPALHKYVIQMNLSYSMTFFIVGGSSGCWE